jgi:hypothetical protein
MSAKKNKKYLITPGELAEFKAYAKANKLTNLKLAEIFCVCNVTVGANINKGEVVRLWPKHLQLLEENKRLEQENDFLYTKLRKILPCD